MAHIICSLPSFSCGSASAFVHHQPKYNIIARLSSTFPTNRMLSTNLAEKSSTSSVCDVSDINIPDLVSTKGSASILRESVLKNVNGDNIRLGDCMGKATSIIVFLRHLA